MCDSIAAKLVLFFLLYHDVFVLANVYDCWDPDKLQKMKFKETKGKSFFTTHFLVIFLFFE